MLNAHKRHNINIHRNHQNAAASKCAMNAHGSRRSHGLCHFVQTKLHLLSSSGLLFSSRHGLSPQNHGMHPVTSPGQGSDVTGLSRRLCTSSQVHHPCLHLFSLKWLINFGFHTSQTSLQHPSTSFNILQHPSTTTDELHNSHPILLDELQVLALRLDDVLLPGLGGMAHWDRP